MRTHVNQQRILNLYGLETFDIIIEPIVVAQSCELFFPRAYAMQYSAMRMKKWVNRLDFHASLSRVCNAAISVGCSSKTFRIQSQPRRIRFYCMCAKRPYCNVQFQPRKLAICSRPTHGLGCEEVNFVWNENKKKNDHRPRERERPNPTSTFALFVFIQ